MNQGSVQRSEIMSEQDAKPLVSRDELADIAIAISTDNDRAADPLHVGMIITALTKLWRQYEARIARLEAERDELQTRGEAAESKRLANTWQPVNPIYMVEDKYDDAEIKLCYRRTTTQEVSDDKGY